MEPHPTEDDMLVDVDDDQTIIQAMLDRGELEQARRKVFSAAALEMLDHGLFPSRCYSFNSLMLLFF